ALLLRSDTGRTLPLDPHRWHDEATPAERDLLAALTGPVLDVGCGPGRLVVGLARRGTVALGIDPAPGAVEIARRRGAAVLQRSVFDPVPGQGRWRTVLIAEVEAPGAGLARHRARLERGATRGPWFPWAVVGTDALPAVAGAAGLRV